MGQDFYYTVTVQLLSRDCKCRTHRTQRFEDEDTARASAALLADVLYEDGTLFDIDVYYIDINHKSWLTGYNNLPE